MKIGFNYIPSTAGCGFWIRWDHDEIKRDLSGIATLGFEVVRFFIFWRDFEPSPGKYRTQLLNRLETFVEIADRLGLECIPSILTVWMNGQLFDLPWREGRDLWSDGMMRKRARDFSRVIAARLVRFGNIYAYDIGDEIIEAPIKPLGSVDSPTAERWYAEVAGAVRSTHPGIPVFQANQGHFLWTNSGFNTVTASLLDGTMIHGFPAWTPFSIESSASYKARLYPGFLARLAQAFSSRVILDEFGCYGVSEALLGAFVATSGASCLATGAEALIPWCWRDIANTEKPYDLRMDERLAGFTRLNGDPKPAMNSLEAIRDLRDSLRFARPTVPEVGILVPSLSEDNRAHGYLSVERPSVRALFTAYLLAKRAHFQVGFTTNPSNNHTLLIVPCQMRMTASLDEVLRQYVHSGGTLLYSPGTYMEGVGSRELFGIELDDFTVLPQRLYGFRFEEVNFDIYGSLPADNRRQLPIVRLAGGASLAYFRDGTPALIQNRFGSGTAVYLNSFFEELLDVPGRLEHRQWHALYSAVGRMAGVPLPGVSAEPHVELASFDNELDPIRAYWLCINHAEVPAIVTGGNSDKIELVGNSFKLLAASNVSTDPKSEDA